jgi:hypothetical protein
MYMIMVRAARCPLPAAHCPPPTPYVALSCPVLPCPALLPCPAARLQPACRPDCRPMVSFALTRTAARLPLSPSRWPSLARRRVSDPAAILLHNPRSPTQQPGPRRCRHSWSGASSPPRLARTALVDAAMPASTLSVAATRLPRLASCT